MRAALKSAYALQQVSKNRARKLLTNCCFEVNCDVLQFALTTVHAKKCQNYIIIPRSRRSGLLSGGLLSVAFCTVALCPGGLLSGPRNPPPSVSKLTLFLNYAVLDLFIAFPVCSQLAYGRSLALH